MKEKIKRLKEEFREWCGLLSVEEIISNPSLIEAIKRIESLLQGATA